MRCRQEVQVAPTLVVERLAAQIRPLPDHDDGMREQVREHERVLRQCLLPEHLGGVPRVRCPFRQRALQRRQAEQRRRRRQARWLQRRERHRRLGSKPRQLRHQLAEHCRCVLRVPVEKRLQFRLTQTQRRASSDLHAHVGPGAEQRPLPLLPRTVPRDQRGHQRQQLRRMQLQLEALTGFQRR